MTLPQQMRFSRRAVMGAGAFCLSPLALGWLDQSARAEPVKPDLQKRPATLRPKPPAHPPKAQAMISLFMQGGPSQVDLLDPKPTLNRMDGQDFPGKVKYDDVGGASRRILGSPWKFQKHGESGIEVSELLPGIARVADDITVIRSMHTGVNNHGQSIHAMNSGRIQRGRPALGSWITYALGAETNELPAYVAMTDPKGIPVEGVLNWSNGWLPSLFQGTVIRPREPRILNLEAPTYLRDAAQRNYLAYLNEINSEHADAHPDDAELRARIANYELAARMQLAATDALDLSRETTATHRLYGIGQTETDEYGRRCLIARRLIERGVRFVQLFTKNQYWDHHQRIIKSLPEACKKTDVPIGGLMTDLKQRGLLESTIVHWGGEMGRLPVIQNDAGRETVGRDHNTYGFSMWVAGGGFKAGTVHGATDEFGHHAVEDIVNHYDYHATLLDLLGLSQDQVAYLRSGQQESLLDGQPGRIVKKILA